jgi:hypothetical protein
MRHMQKGVKLGYSLVGGNMRRGDADDAQTCSGTFYDAGVRRTWLSIPLSGRALREKR